MASSPPPKIAIAAPKMGVDPLNSLNPESPLSSINQDGTQLWPDLMPRLDSEPRVGTLLVMRDKADRKTKVHLPWATSASNPVADVLSEWLSDDTLSH
jgi:hypothetical protein